jgi:hypothetical protein
MPLKKHELLPHFSAQANNPEESQTPFKQLHLLGAKVFIRSDAVITRYVSEAAVPAGS